MRKNDKRAKRAFLDHSRRNPQFEIRYTDGTRLKFTKRIPWPDAEKMLEQIRHRIELGTFEMEDYAPPRRLVVGLGAAAVEYVERGERLVQMRQWSKRTLEKATDTLLLFVAVIGKRAAMCDLGVEDVEKFVLELTTKRKTQYGGNYSPASVDSYLIALTPFWSWAIEKGYAQENAISKYRKTTGKKKKKDLPKFATAEEIAAIREQLGKRSEWQLDCFNFALWTSARASEVLSVRANDCAEMETANGKKMFVRIEGKGEKERFTPLGPEAAAMVRRRLEWLEDPQRLAAMISRATTARSAERLRERYAEKRLFWDVASRHSLGHAVLTARREAGIESKVTFHAARHTYATDLLRQGVELKSVSELLGHADLRTTEGYAKVVRETLLNQLQDIAEI